MQQKRSSEEGFLRQLSFMFSSNGLLPSGLQLTDQDSGADDLENLLPIGIVHNLDNEQGNEQGDTSLKHA